MPIKSLPMWIFFSRTAVSPAVFFWGSASSQLITPSYPKRVVAVGCLLPAPLSSFLVCLQPCLVFLCHLFALNPFCCQPTVRSWSSLLCTLGHRQRRNRRPWLHCILPTLTTLFLTSPAGKPQTHSRGWYRFGRLFWPDTCLSFPVTELVLAWGWRSLSALERKTFHGRSSVPQD